MAFQHKTKYGQQHQPIHIQPFTVDRTNLFNGRVEYHVDEDFDRPNAAFLSPAFGSNTIAAMAGVTGLIKGGKRNAPLCVGVERRYDREMGLAIYTYLFEGLVNSSQRFIDFELEFTMNQEPIETHPSFQTLNELFGPYDALNRLWPRYISNETASTGLGGGQTSQGAATNPLYGVTSYLSPGAIYRLSFCDTDVDSDFMDDVGAIVKPPKLGEAFPEFNSFLQGTKRNWLKLAPKIRQHGAAISIIEEYMLSGPRGWDENIYSADALKGQTL